MQAGDLTRVRLVVRSIEVIEHPDTRVAPLVPESEVPVEAGVIVALGVVEPAFEENQGIVSVVEMALILGLARNKIADRPLNFKAKWT